MTAMETVRADIRALSAYQVARLPEGCVKLDAMESPYDFPPEMKRELGDILANVPFRLYPHISDDDFIPRLKAAHGIPDAAAVALGNGSDELIQLITMLVARPDAKVMGIEPTFVMYRHNAALYGMEYIGVDVDDDLTLNLERVLEAIRIHRPALIFLAYPNNPTGIRYPREAVERIIAAATGLVVIDEAYGAFSSDSFLARAGSSEQLLVLRTFSKIGFAGMRLGYASGSPTIIGELAKIVPPYNMNQFTLAAAKYALDHGDWIARNISCLKMEREVLLSELEDIERIRVFPSEANFLTLRVPDADECFNVLLKQGFLVKNLHGVHPLLNQCLRITVSLPEHNAAMVKILRSLYG